MPFAVVLDTCVLYPAHLRDTLLRFAERGLYRALWSQDIIDELHRNLLEAGIDIASVDNLIVEMRIAFPDAEVTNFDSLIDGLTCHPKDGHVLAAAVKAEAAVLLTFNLDDFPEASVEPFNMEVVHPDAFLLEQLDLAPEQVLDELMRQAAANQRVPKTLPGLLDALAKAGVPTFAEAVRRRTTRQT